MKEKNSMLFVLGLLFFLAIPHHGYCCVGRILNLAITNTTDQQVMGRLLATYITERTGTTVNLVKAPDLDTARKMVQEGKANIYLNYIGDAAKELGKTASGATPQETCALLKQAYLQKYGLVWLKPFGYSGPNDLKQSAGGSLAAAITSTDTLEKFPILGRLINKLAGKISLETLRQLKEEAAETDLTAAAKGFLKKKNLI